MSSQKNASLLTFLYLPHLIIIVIFLFRCFVSEHLSFCSLRYHSIKGRTRLDGVELEKCGGEHGIRWGRTRRDELDRGRTRCNSLLQLKTNSKGKAQRLENKKCWCWSVRLNYKRVLAINSLQNWPPTLISSCKVFFQHTLKEHRLQAVNWKANSQIS